MSTNQEEINKFNQLASRWWDTQGVMKPLHEINPLRLGFIEEKINLSGKQVLDVGCGGGILAESMAKRGAHVTGLDLAPQVIEVAKHHAAENQLAIDYQCKDVTILAAEQPHSFDVVTCMEMLEHVDDPDIIIKACAKLAKPGAPIFFATINRTPKAYLQAILGAEYVLGLLPRGTHDYQHFIRPAELEQSCRNAAIQIKQLKGMTYHLLSRTYALIDNVDVNYLVYAVSNNQG